LGQDTIVAIATFLATFLTTVALVLRSNSSQRAHIDTAASKIDEATKRQDAATELLNKTLHSALTVKDGLIADDRKEIANLKSDVVNYKELLDSALREIDNMRADLRGMRAEHDQRIREMQIQIDGLLKENTEKDRQLNALTDAIKKREDAIGDYVQRVDRLERALNDKDISLTEAQTLIGNLKQNEQRTADELNQLRERVRNLEAKVSELQAERGVLLAERDAARAEIVRVQSEKAVLLARIDTLESQVRQMTAVRTDAPPLAERSTAEIAAQ
jgi:chromosome segregation ATPase